MLICGLKLTHDGAIALIEDNRLIASVEMEKLGNNARYTEIHDTDTVSQVLAAYGCRPEDVDHFVIDGWGGYDPQALAIQPRLTIGDPLNKLSVRHGGNSFQLDIAQYQERSLKHDVLEMWKGEGLRIGEGSFSYSTSLHVTGHIMSAYCTSPFAGKGESAYILVWDGGMYPCLYFFDAERKEMASLGPLFLLIGNIYTIFSQHFGPFRVSESFAKDELSVAGKVMAYIALGQERRELFAVFQEIYTRSYDQPMGFANRFATEFKKKTAGKGYSDEDILLSFHVYLEELLVEKLIKKVQRSGRASRNICLAGGCALNIKWNSAIRNSGFFSQVYVPPFPNDSGSALGAACTGAFSIDGQAALQWSVFGGPAIISDMPAAGWTASECTIGELARILHETDEPVLVLNGRAELGPRALGNRSIIAAAGSPAMKDILNKVKEREPYRPVSPMCLEERARDIFIPGTPDPYMVFDHMVREEWLDRIVAACHIDGSARLQTINPEGNAMVYELLCEYEKLSGIPVLCNTSANFKGKGFFPSISSAAEWGKLNYIWSDNKLFEKEQKRSFSRYQPSAVSLTHLK